jgi:hypothetical protein
MAERALNGRHSTISGFWNAKIKNLPFAEKKQVYLNPEETLPKLGFRRRHPVAACELNQYFRNHEN